MDEGREAWMPEKDGFEQLGILAANQMGQAFHASNAWMHSFAFAVLAAGGALAAAAAAWALEILTSLKSCIQ